MYDERPACAGREESHQACTTRGLAAPGIGAGERAEQREPTGQGRHRKIEQIGNRREEEKERSESERMAERMEGREREQGGTHG